MATLVSVNVGLPRNVEWQHRTVYTGAWKEPVAGPRMVRRLNVDGDGQGDLGGHGGENRAVLVYQLDSYRHWATRSGGTICARLSGREPHRRRIARRRGVHRRPVPDRRRGLGGHPAAGHLLPRGMRIGEPRMAALLVAHRRPGFYCRVITEGHVRGRPRHRQDRRRARKVSVAEIDALLYLPGHPRDALDRARRIPALSPGWQMSLQALAEQAQNSAASTGNPGSPPPPGPAPAWTGFRPLQVRDVHEECCSVRVADPRRSRRGAGCRNGFPANRSPCGCPP